MTSNHETATPPATAKATRWEENALCRQVDVGELFYPEKGQNSGEAKKVCSTCDVEQACLEHAVKNKETEGIWGGTSPGERRNLTIVEVHQRFSMQAQA